MKNFIFTTVLVLTCLCMLGSAGALTSDLIGFKQFFIQCGIESCIAYGAYKLIA